MWGKTQGGVCALTPLRCIDETAPLIVGEGIETTLSAYAYWAARGVLTRAAATLSLANLQGYWLTDDEGAAAQWPPRLDMKRGPWTLRQPGAVVIVADRDMAPIKIKARAATGAPIRKHLDGEARAQLCAALAAQAWTAAGASRVDIALPQRPGADLNDMLKEAQ
jgi:hypothetical protein